MIRQIELQKFKCFEILKLPVTELTLLSGSNASGKSSLLHALVLLHQSIRENEWNSRLVLNGDILKLGTVQDVVNKIHGRHEFELVICDEKDRFAWSFKGGREEMSMQVQFIQGNEVTTATPGNFFKLVPSGKGEVSHPITNTLENLTYITAERIGPQEFYSLEDRSTVQTVGTKGEHAVSILHRLKDKAVSDKLALASSPSNLQRQVEAWMKHFFPGCGIDVQPISRMNAVTLGLRTSEETDFHRPVNVGFGLTQIMPIIVAVLSANEDDLILIENPEVHLHPAGQALMGGFLAQAASSGRQIILETHSDHVLNGIRRAVRHNTLAPSKVALHFFRPPQKGFDQVVSPQLDSKGNIDLWPEGFFDQFDKDMNHFAGWGD